MHTDNGGEFRNHILEAICKEKGIKQISGAPYHSQSQGLVERFNRSLQESLTYYRQQLASEAAIGAKDSSASKYELKKCCRAVLKEYNTKKHSTIYMTPNEAYL